MSKGIMLARVALIVCAPLSSKAGFAETKSIVETAQAPAFSGAADRTQCCGLDDSAIRVWPLAANADFPPVPAATAERNGVPNQAADTIFLSPAAELDRREGLTAIDSNAPLSADQADPPSVAIDNVAAPPQSALRRLFSAFIQFGAVATSR